MCIFHKWEKWEQYEVNIPARRLTKSYGLCASRESRQRKRCMKCGKVKDELINIVITD